MDIMTKKITRKNYKTRGGKNKTHKSIKYIKRINDANNIFFKELIAYISYFIEMFGVEMDEKLNKKVESALKSAIAEYKKNNNSSMVDSFNIDNEDENARLIIIDMALKKIEEENSNAKGIDDSFLVME